MAFASLEAQREYTRVWRAANREKVRGYRAKWMEANRDKISAKNRRHREKHPDVHRRAGWRKRGLPMPTRPEPAGCESCGCREPGRPLNLDHCHTSGEFRGWLCGPCNRGLGQFKDSIARMEQAIAYLRTAEKIKGTS